jgi:hypothetical protein
VTVTDAVAERALPGGPGEVSGSPQVGADAESTRHDALQNGTVRPRDSPEFRSTAGGRDDPCLCAEWISVIDPVSQ